MWDSTKPHLQELQIILIRRSKEPMPILGLKKHMNRHRADMQCRYIGRKGTHILFCDSVLLWEWDQTHSSRPYNLSASSLLSQETPGYQLLFSCPPYAKYSNWLPGSDQANNALWGVLLEERWFWNYLKKYPDLVLSCQELHSSSPTNLPWLTHCLLVSGRLYWACCQL